MVEGSQRALVLLTIMMVVLMTFDCIVKVYRILNSQCSPTLA